MLYKHIVKYGDRYYMPGEEVPVESFADTHKEKAVGAETYDTLNERSIKGIKLMALDRYGKQIEAVRKDDVIAEYLRLQEG